MMLICRYHVLGVFLLMMITSDVVLAEDADDEDEGPGSKNTTVIDVSLIPGFRILFSADKREGNVLRLALRPDPQTHEEGSFLAPRSALLGTIYFSFIDRYLWPTFPFPFPLPLSFVFCLII